MLEGVVLEGRPRVGPRLYHVYPGEVVLEGRPRVGPRLYHVCPGLADSLAQSPHVEHGGSESTHLTGDWV